MNALTYVPQINSSNSIASVQIPDCIPAAPVEVFGCCALVSGVIRGTSTVSSHLMILTYNKYVSQKSLTEGATHPESPKSPSRRIRKYGLLGNLLWHINT